jgi:hypothetical protein
LQQLEEIMASLEAVDSVNNFKSGLKVIYGVSESWEQVNISAQALDSSMLGNNNCTQHTMSLAPRQTRLIHDIRLVHPIIHASKDCIAVWRSSGLKHMGDSTEQQYVVSMPPLLTNTLCC